MSVMIPTTGSNERRHNAELPYKEIILRRVAELNAAAFGAQSATIRVYPDMFATPSPAPVEKAPLPTVNPEVAGNVIQLASERDKRVLSEQEQRLEAARLATEEALHETAA